MRSRCGFFRLGLPTHYVAGTSVLLPGNEGRNRARRNSTIRGRRTDPELPAPPGSRQPRSRPNPAQPRRQRLSAAPCDSGSSAGAGRIRLPGAACARRILRRYRPGIPEARAEALLTRLVWSYPCHGFVIDLEECRDLGLPARPGSALETPVLDGFAAAFRLLEPGTAILEVHAPRAHRTGSGRDGEFPEHDTEAPALPAA